MPPRPPSNILQSSLSLPPSFLAPRLTLPITNATARRSIKSIQQPPRHHNSKWNKGRNLPVLQASREAAEQRLIVAHTLPLRTGAIAVKKGMTALYDPETGKRTPCTVLQLDRVQVVAHKTKREHGYFAVQVGSGWKHKKNVTKPLLGHFSTAGVAPKRHLFEFRVMDESGLVPVGASIPADWFIEGQFIDTKSNSKGHGFTGGMKRWGFHGAGASHGTSLTHRAMGSAGQGQGGGSRVYPGKKMAGRMGNEQVTVQNVKVLQVDGERGILVVHGCVTGPKGCLVKIQDAKKKPWPQDAPKMLPLPVVQPAEGEVGDAVKVVV